MHLEPGVERGVAAREIERHMPAAVLRRRAGDRKYPRLTLLPMLLGEIGLRLDDDAAPPLVLQMQRLREPLGIVRSDFDEESGCRMAEEFLLERLFGGKRENGFHRLVSRFRSSQDLAAHSVANFGIICS